MRFSLGVLACGFGVLSLVACGGDDGESRLLGPDRISENGEKPNDEPAPKPTDDPPPITCAADIPQPTLVANDGAAKDVFLTKRGVIFRAGPTVVQVGRDGKNKRQLATTPNVVSSWADDGSLVLVESVPDTETSVLRVINLEKLPEPDPNKPDQAPPTGIAAPTAINAGSIEIFASDATGFYMLAEAAGTEALYRVEKANPLAMTLLTSTKTDKITYPVLANGFVWYVKNGQRIFKVGAAQPVEGEPDENGIAPLLPALPPGPPQEVFGISYASVRLAVDEKNAFYSTGNLLEKRDLTGANPAVLLDTEKSKSKASFSTPIATRDAVLIPSLTADPSFKHIIRSVKVTAQGAEERLVACGRDAAPTNVVADGTSIAWAEAGKGVFITPR